MPQIVSAMGGVIDCCARPPRADEAVVAADGGFGASAAGDRNGHMDARWAAEAKTEALAAWTSHFQGRDAQPKHASLSGAPGAHLCLVRAEFFENRFTGLFRRADYGLARLCASASAACAPTIAQRALEGLGSWLPSGAAPPRSRSCGAPVLELQFFRGRGAGCGQLLFVGSASSPSFAQHLCTQGGDPAAAAAIAGRLARESAWPEAAGLSEFAQTAQDGRSVEEADFPWALVLRPCQPLADSPLAHLEEVPAGTAIYDIYACPAPGTALDVAWLELIGRLYTCSPVLPEPPCHAPWRFCHYPKEDDYALRPSWLRELSRASATCGAGHFGGLIERRERIFGSRGGGWAPQVLPHTAWSWDAGAVASTTASPASSRSSSTSSYASCQRSESSCSSSASLASALRLRGGRAQARGPAPPALSPRSFPGCAEDDLCRRSVDDNSFDTRAALVGGALATLALLLALLTYSGVFRLERGLFDAMRGAAMHGAIAWALLSFALLLLGFAACRRSGPRAVSGGPVTQPPQAPMRTLRRGTSSHEFVVA